MKRFRIIWRRVTLKGRKSEYIKHKEAARALAYERLTHYNQIYGFKFGRVAIKNSKSRWGSCSKKGNLNFNYKISLLPPDMADYVIVHELCHLGEFNHSERFWKLVERTVPNWRAIRGKFKTIRL